MAFKYDIAGTAFGLRRFSVCLLTILALNLSPDMAQAGPREQVVALYREGARLQAHGDYAGAAQKLERAVQLGEQAFGPDNRQVGALVSNLGTIYGMQGRYADAESAFKRELTIMTTALGPDNPEVATAYSNLAGIYAEQARYAEAEVAFKQATAVLEKAAGTDSPELTDTLRNLALLYDRQARFAEAETLYNRILAIYEKVRGPDDPIVATPLTNLANHYSEQGRFAEAAPLYKRALALYEAGQGPNHPQFALGLVNYAINEMNRARYAEAELLLKRALAIDERAYGSDHPAIVSVLDNLAGLYENQGRFPEAELVHRRALAIEEKTFGPNHPNVAVELNSLALPYETEGQYSEAESLYKRALAVDEKAFGPDHPEAATGLDNLASIYVRQGRFEEAETLLKRALAIREKTLGPDHPAVALNLNNLAVQYKKQRRYADAEAFQRRALAIDEKIFGPESPLTAQSIDNLGTDLMDQGRYAEAEPLYKRALAIDEKTEGADHPNIALSYLEPLATIYDQQGRATDALAASRQAVSILTRHVTQDAGSPDTLSWQRRTRPTYLELIHLLSNGPSASQGTTPAIADEAFRASQYAGGIETAQALAGMTARAAAGSDALAALVRSREDLSSRRQKLDASLIAALSQPPDKRSPTIESALRKEMAEVDAKQKADDQRLQSDFPRFAELAVAHPVGIAELQSVLGPQEAFVAWTFSDQEGFLFAIRNDRVKFIKIDMTAAQAAEIVTALRASLVDETTVDIGKAYDLYRRLLAPAESLIADAKHLIIVPDGAMQSLPPSVLVTALPHQAIRNYSDYKSVPWLIRRQALTVLPAASSLVSLRRFAKAQHPEAPFIGFGDPDFQGDGTKRGINASALFRGSEANTQALRGLPRLQETADELRAQAQALGAPASSVHLGAEASVTNVEHLDLTNIRVVAFATHGLIAGDLPSLTEPALALSPPSHPTEDDDGLLRASQVAQLKLNADFVVLSACNTASPDGTPGAEGLSGLAKAFFYAGARSLLVSHWPVDSDATVKLTTGLFRAVAADPSIGRAEALRRSILALIDEAPKDSDQAHPSSWAPFILAGEGGANR